MLPIWTIVNNAVVRTERHVSFQVSVLFFSDIYMYPGVELLGQMVLLFLVFSETAILFSIVALPIYIPTSSVRGFPFLCTHANNCYFCFLFLFLRIAILTGYRCMQSTSREMPGWINHKLQSTLLGEISMTSDM